MSYYIEIEHDDFCKEPESYFIAGVWAVAVITSCLRNRFYDSISEAEKECQTASNRALFARYHSGMQRVQSPDKLSTLSVTYLFFPALQTGIKKTAAGLYGFNVKLHVRECNEG
jgi:hypothetical protein